MKCKICYIRETVCYSLFEGACSWEIALNVNVGIFSGTCRTGEDVREKAREVNMYYRSIGACKQKMGR
jgi:hypothetical protein